MVPEGQMQDKKSFSNFITGEGSFMMGFKDHNLEKR